MSEFQKLALERFSCRKFSDASVDNALIEKVLKIALAAPTAVNKQPFRIWVLSDDVAQRFAEHNPYHFGGHVRRRSVGTSLRSTKLCQCRRRHYRHAHYACAYRLWFKNLLGGLI